jgi:hypothetical protein
VFAILRMALLAWHVLWLRMSCKARFTTLVVDQVCCAPLTPPILKLLRAAVTAESDHGI